MHIVTIIPAAGKSSRMGKDKPFLEIKGKTIISQQVEIIKQTSLLPVYIITNHPDMLKDQIDTSVTVIVNANNKTFSMLESIRLGIQKTPANTTGAMVVPGDFPLDTADLINKLRAVFNDNPKKIVLPVFKNKRGHPIVIPAKFFKNIISSYDDLGLKGLLVEFSNSVLEVDWPDNSVLTNLNFARDYKKYIMGKRE